ncbi:MAG: O-antigen ligase family protein [Actinomycetota bacterium]|nr:O-antigen ligase family protein [Actinomycetota bacterium]
MSAIAFDRRPSRIWLRELSLPQGWQAYALFLAIPLWWVLGLSHFIWPVIAFPILLSLLLYPERLRIPRGFGIWLVFLAWMLASALEIDSGGRMVGFTFRFLTYASGTVLFLYFYNASPRRIPASAVVNALAGYWLIVIVGGFLGIFFPNVTFTTPAAHVIPESLMSNDFVHDMVTASFASVQTFLGYPLGRPHTFFTYTNGWGSAVGLLTPFALCAIQGARSRRWRQLLTVALILALVPAIISMNRGLWLSLLVTVTYAAFRFANRNNIRALARLATAVVIAAAVVISTPLSHLIMERFAHQHSNPVRKALYVETFQRAAHSPLLGYGAPRPAESKRYLESAGTQGQVFYLVFSHGFPGLVLYLGWLVHTLFRTRRIRSTTGFWAHASILAALVQASFYGLTMATFVIMTAAALALRELDAGEDPGESNSQYQVGRPLTAMGVAR